MRASQCRKLLYECRYNENLVEFPNQYNLSAKRVTWTAQLSHVLGFLNIAIRSVVGIYANMVDTSLVNLSVEPAVCGFRDTCSAWLLYAFFQTSFISQWSQLSPVKRRGYSVELFGLSVRLSVCPSVPKSLYAHLRLAATFQQIDTYTIWAN